MGKDKQKRFDELTKLPNVFQNIDFNKPVLEHLGKPTFDLKGKWNSSFFNKNNPIVLELACGKGEYTVGLAKRNPNKNYIGIDIKGARLHNGASIANRLNLKNAAFLRCKIELLPMFFEKNEVSEIWIVFSDPYPKDRHAKHRLSSPNFIELYKSICKPKSLLHLKTDSELLFNYTLGVLDGKNMKYNEVERDIYNKGTKHKELIEIQTFYEKKHLLNGKRINYLNVNL